MEIEIKHRWTLNVIFERDVDGNSARLTVEAAVRAKANLSGANLSGANLSDADLQPIRADFYDVLSHAGKEVPALIDALKAGRVDGSTYSGECACLVGTLANVRGVDYKTFGPDVNRPIERFFLAIRKGDTPKTNQASRLAVEWAESWLATQRAAFSSEAK